MDSELCAPCSGLLQSRCVCFNRSRPCCPLQECEEGLEGSGQPLLVRKDPCPLIHTSQLPLSVIRS